MSVLVKVGLVILASSSILATASLEGIHIPIHRRGGRFSAPGVANLSRLAQTLLEVEARYARSYRDVEQNGLVRRWHQNDPTVEDVAMLEGMGREGNWYASLVIGTPPQRLQFEIDLLHPDFFTVMTTSERGQRYNTTNSKTHGYSEGTIHPLCRKTTDTFYLHESTIPERLVFPICSPLQSTVHTLLPDGSGLGLGPAGSLARLPQTSIIKQLWTRSLITDQVWSMTLLDSASGILSLGTTIAYTFENMKLQAEIELKNMGQPHATSDWIRSQINPQLDAIRELPWREHFKWTKLKGAEGWWTGLMSGLWINGAKVLKNQPMLFDVQCPFILAPPVAVERVYESVGGAFRLPQPHDQFFAFPCLNAVNVAFEVGGWNFPVMNGDMSRDDALNGPVGGRFSLGLMDGGKENEEIGTGYCVGIVVETRMGLEKEWENSGMQDTWVIGEPFFRSMGVVFDQGRGMIGLRSY